VKQVIEKLVKAYDWIEKATPGNEDYCDYLSEAMNLIDEVLSILKSPRWETPEQREKRTGKKWPDKASVYIRLADGELQVEEYWRALQMENDLIRLDKDFGDTHVPLLIICATEAGPPPDDWGLE
jgi:hypothetical protein